MKNLILASLLILGFANACKIKNYIIVDTPCGDKETGVNVRIKNSGDFAFTSFYLVVDGNKYEFKGCKPGDISCYKNVPYIFTHNSYNIAFKEIPVNGGSIENSNGITIQFSPDKKDLKPKIDKGTFTINVVTKGTFSKPLDPVIELNSDK